MKKLVKVEDGFYIYRGYMIKKSGKYCWVYGKKPENLKLETTLRGVIDSIDIELRDLMEEIKHE